MPEAYIREIFKSVQGEGTHVGEQQLFIRFCSCNLKCEYCDTDFEISKSEKYTVSNLTDKVNSFGSKLVLSLTGGEPLMSVGFLKKFLPVVKNLGHTVYLETNGTLPDKLSEIIDYVDVVAADIKLESSTKMNIHFKDIDKFLKIASKTETFAKVVFDENITEDEINTITKLVEKYDIELILQPKTENDKICISSELCEEIFAKFRTNYIKVRLIPQMHKFLNVR